MSTGYRILRKRDVWELFPKKTPAASIRVVKINFQILRAVSVGSFCPVRMLPNSYFMQGLEYASVIGITAVQQPASLPPLEDRSGSD